MLDYRYNKLVALNKQVGQVTMAKVKRSITLTTQVSAPVCHIVLKTSDDIYWELARIRRTVLRQILGHTRREL
jgi:hypothetical protein